ncbi:hypothetical protein ACH5RR_039066 [Cinchona calisaya]|uniref:Uncharacterized protein n=1 Tax=Cinchona calisaya TaxID=153742 RepID=A0ABD2XYI8_9GENT
MHDARDKHIGMVSNMQLILELIINSTTLSNQMEVEPTFHEHIPRLRTLVLGLINHTMVAVKRNNWRTDGNGANFSQAPLEVENMGAGIDQHTMVIVVMKLGLRMVKNNLVGLKQKRIHMDKKRLAVRTWRSRMLGSRRMRIFREDQATYELNSDLKSSDEEGDAIRINYTNSRADLEMKEPQFQIGMKFSRKGRIINVLDNYSIIHGKPLH